MSLLVEILSTGDELLTGQVVDTNSTWLMDQLWDLGLMVRRKTLVGDDRTDLLHGLSLAFEVRNLFGIKPPYVNLAPSGNGSGGYDASARAAQLTAGGWEGRLVLRAPGVGHGFAAVDFESDDLGHGLRDAGFYPDRPAFFIWLGVVPYLGRAAIAATLRYIASIQGSEVVFDYSEPLENYPPERRAGIVALGAYTAEVGEPWLSHFDPDEIAQELRGYGFGDLEDLGMSQMAVRYLGAPAGAPDSGPGGHMIRAARTA